jgi:hypothetical protein
MALAVMEPDEVALAAVVCSQVALLPVSCLDCSGYYDLSLEIPLKQGSNNYEIIQHSVNKVGMLVHKE